MHLSKLLRHTTLPFLGGFFCCKKFKKVIKKG
nr:MAG TPA: hypothetical protein [Caudoviricetes sp.]